MIDDVWQEHIVDVSLYLKAANIDNQW
jgi:hypothetical protein